MSENFFKVLIVGEPNVGKSTLLNKLTGRRNAIVLDEPGVTRDIKIMKRNFFGHEVEFIDTPGISDYLKFSKIPNKKKTYKEVETELVNQKFIDERITFLRKKGKNEEILSEEKFENSENKNENNWENSNNKRKNNWENSNNKRINNWKIFKNKKINNLESAENNWKNSDNRNENNWKNSSSLENNNNLEEKNFSIQNFAEINAIKFIDESNLVLFMIDGTKEISRNIIDAFNSLRKKGKDLITVINKCDSKKMNEVNVYSIGLINNPIIISAEHKIGINELEEEIYQKVLNFFSEDKNSNPNTSLKMLKEEKRSKRNKNNKSNNKYNNEENFKENFNNDEEVFSLKEEKTPIKIVILGKPNVGKSTLVNSLIEKNVQLVADIPGVTRDTAEFQFENDGTKFLITDTAGIRKKSKMNEAIEKISASKAIQSMNFSEVVILMVDASELEKENEENFLSQDITLASMAAKEGRAVVIALNKFDKVKDQKKLLAELNEKIKNKLSQLGGLKIIPISALNGNGLKNLLLEIKNVYEIWNKKISTSKLNSWLRETVSSFPPPAEANRRSKLKYITQGHRRPPFFIIFCTRRVEIPEQYEKFLINRMREKFGLFGVPIRLSFREQKNPFHEKK